MSERVKQSGMGPSIPIVLGIGLFVTSFALSALVSIDVGMGAGMMISLMDIPLHACARLLKTPWQILCFVLPVGVAQGLLGNYLMLPCIVVVRLVCVLMVAKAYRDLPESSRDTSMLPFLVHGFWLIIGVTLYDAFVFGLIRFIIGILIGIVEWVIAGGLSVVLMRLLSRHVLRNVGKEGTQ